MRNVFFLMVFIFMVSCNKQDSIQGSWTPIQQEMDGTELPRSAFENSELTIKGNQYILTAEGVDKGELKFDENKITVKGKEGPNAGREFKAIYKIENGLLTICYNLAGDEFPKDFETLGNPLYLKSVFKRIQ